MFWVIITWKKVFPQNWQILSHTFSPQWYTTVCTMQYHNIWSHCAFEKPNLSLKLVKSCCAFEILTRIYQSCQKLGHCAFKKSFSKARWGFWLVVALFVLVALLSITPELISLWVLFILVFFGLDLKSGVTMFLFGAIFVLQIFWNMEIKSRILVRVIGLSSKVIMIWMRRLVFWISFTAFMKYLLILI